MPKPVASPNYGLYLNLPPISVPSKGLKDGYNFRVKNGVLSNLNLGWELFYPEGVNVGGRVTVIANFFPRELPEKLLFFTLTDILVHDPITNRPLYLTPLYDTGTASANGTAVTGTGTNWDPDIDAGDFIHFGDANYTTVDAADWFEIDTVDSATGITLVSSAGVVADGPYTIRKIFNGNVDDQWSVETFVQDETSGDDFIIATNGVDPVVSWNGTDAEVTLQSAMNFTAKFLVRFSNMMIYGNVVSGGVSYPTSIINSDVGKPFAAGDTGTGLSEQFRVTDRAEPLVGGKVLGNNLILYSPRVGIVTQFAGDPLIFIFRIGFTDVGPISRRSIMDFGDYHEFFSADGEYSFDGVNIREISKHVGRDLIRTADPVRRVYVYGHFDEENGDLIWSVPGTTDPDSGDAEAPPVTGWSEHYLEVMPMGVDRPWSKRAWPFTATGYYTRNEGLTWATAAGTWAEYNYSWNDQFASLGFPLNLGGDADGLIYIINQSQTGNGVALPSFVQTGRVPLTDGKERALLARIYPFTGQLNGTLEITTYLADFATSTAIDGGTLEYDTSHIEGRFFVTPYRRARFTETKFGNAAGDAWTLEGWDYEIKKGGMR